MRRIIIVGGGFAGLACARALRHARGLDVTVLDRKGTFDFLPMLPDIVGGRVAPDAARVPFPRLAARDGFRFVRDEVSRLDLGRRRVIGTSGEYACDDLVIAAGTGTNFYGDAAAAEQAFTLDDVNDAVRLGAALDTDHFETVIVVGGGYTGVEIATNIRRRLRRRRRPGVGLVLVEASDKILGPLPAWMRRYVEAHLARLGVEVFVACRANAAGGGRVALSNGRVYDAALLIWAAGVQTPAFVRHSGCAMSRQGRLEVDAGLGIADHVFCIGDAAGVADRGQPLRMAVQFALTEGRLVGENLRRAQDGAPLRPYRPRDPGYIVPMAYGRACGLVLGRRLQGWPALLLHYLMCLVRTVGLAQKLRLLRSLKDGRG